METPTRKLQEGKKEDVTPCPRYIARRCLGFAHLFNGLKTLLSGGLTRGSRVGPMVLFKIPLIGLFQTYCGSGVKGFGLGSIKVSPAALARGPELLPIRLGLDMFRLWAFVFIFFFETNIHFQSLGLSSDWA